MGFFKFTLIFIVGFSSRIIAQDSIVHTHITYTGVKSLEKEHWVVAIDFHFNQKDSIEVRSELLVNWNNVMYGSSWFYYDGMSLNRNPYSKREDQLMRYKNNKGVILQMESPQLVENYNYLKSTYGYLEFPTAMNIPQFLLIEK